MFILQIKEKIQILNGNNTFFKNEIDLGRNIRGRDLIRDRLCVTLSHTFESISRIKRSEDFNRPHLYFKPSLQSAFCT